MVSPYEPTHECSLVRLHKNNEKQPKSNRFIPAGGALCVCAARAPARPAPHRRAFRAQTCDWSV
eukprot:7904644-Pyramimonas_sp.AAC.1